MPRLIAALPAFNEEKSLPPLLESFDALELPAGWELSVVVVDDGSSDATAQVARENARGLKLEVVQHEKNKGLGEAIKTGLRAALERCIDPEHDVVVCMDADNTHHPKYILDMLERLATGSDLVIASRYQPGSQQLGVPGNRLIYSWGARLLFMVALRLKGVRDYTCGYRAYRLSLVRRGFEIWGDRLIERSGFACTDELLVKLARLKPSPLITEVPFTLRYDLKRGGSKLPLIKTIVHTLHLCFVGGRPPGKN